MKKMLWMLAAILTCGFTLTSCSDDDDDNNVTPKADEPVVLSCAKPDYLKAGDKVALISPSYFTPMENVTKTADVLRSWGLEPVVGPNVGKVVDGKYAGTVAERISDIRWALNNPDIKAIICNRGGYGTIQLIDQLTLAELKASPKWLVGFSDISTLHGLLTRAGVMSIHGTMSSFLAKGGTDATSTLMRDLLLGKVPRHARRRPHASGRKDRIKIKEEDNNHETGQTLDDSRHPDTLRHRPAGANETLGRFPGTV